MISSSESVAGGDGGSDSGSELGGGGGRVGSGRRGKGGGGNGSGGGSDSGGGSGSGGGGGGSGGGAISNGSLRELLQNRTHFDDDDDDDDDEDDDADEGNSQNGSNAGKEAAVKGLPPPAATAVVAPAPGKIAPRTVPTTAARRGIAAGLATGTPSTRRRHRRNRSRGSNSSLTSVESLGIVGAAAPAGPPAAAAAAGTGVVARAIARVEDGPPDDTVKAILAKAKAKQIAEEAAVSVRRQRVAIPKVWCLSHVAAFRRATEQAS